MSNFQARSGRPTANESIDSGLAVHDIEYLLPRVRQLPGRRIPRFQRLPEG
jgi:hypothetical protein